MSSVKNKIPQHKLSRDGNSGLQIRPVPRNSDNSELSEIHRDDHHLLIFIFSGQVDITLDFVSGKYAGPVVLHINAGQVHSIDRINNAKGWIIAVEPFILENEFIDFLNQFTAPLRFSPGQKPLNVYNDTLALAHNMQQSPGNVYMDKAILFYVNAVFCLLINDWRPEIKIQSEKEKRAFVIFQNFTRLLGHNYKSLKKPSAYSASLNITTAHLNDTVKSITGFPLSVLIQQQLVLEAKRLLYFTDMEAREIAYELGYDDAVQFGKLFKKQCGLSPLQFRKQFRD